MASGGNNFKDLRENQLSTFRAVKTVLRQWLIYVLHMHLANSYHTPVFAAHFVSKKSSVLGSAIMRDLCAVKSYRPNCCRPNHMMPVSLGLTAVSSYRARMCGPFLFQICSFRSSPFDRHYEKRQNFHCPRSHQRTDKRYDKLLFNLLT